MNKADLIEAVAARIDSSKKDAAQAVEAVVDAITEAVAKGQKVSISGFGVFEKAARPARTYRRPSTGEAIRKMATSVPRFRPGGDFKAFVAGEKQFVEGAVRAAREAGEAAAAVAESVVESVVESAKVKVGLQHRPEPTPEPVGEAPGEAAEMPTPGVPMGATESAQASPEAPSPEAPEVAETTQALGDASEVALIGEAAGVARTSKPVTGHPGGTVRAHKPAIDSADEHARSHLSRPMREAKAAAENAVAASEQAS